MVSYSWSSAFPQVKAFRWADLVFYVGPGVANRDRPRLVNQCHVVQRLSYARNLVARLAFLGPIFLRPAGGFRPNKVKRIYQPKRGQGLAAFSALEERTLGTIYCVLCQQRVPADDDCRFNTSVLTNAKHQIHIARYPCLPRQRRIGRSRQHSKHNTLWLDISADCILRQRLVNHKKWSNPCSESANRQEAVHKGQFTSKQRRTRRDRLIVGRLTAW